jgi:hypothetical protein
MRKWSSFCLVILVVIYKSIEKLHCIRKPRLNFEEKKIPSPVDVEHVSVHTYCKRHERSVHYWSKSARGSSKKDFLLEADKCKIALKYFLDMVYQSFHFILPLAPPLSYIVR